MDGWSGGFFYSFEGQVAVLIGGDRGVWRTYEGSVIGGVLSWVVAVEVEFDGFGWVGGIESQRCLRNM